MLRFFTVLFFLVTFKVSAQTSAPKLINYQGVARDAAGVPITAPFDIQFIIKDISQVVHNETQNGIQPNALGLFTTKIGISPTFTYSGWGSSSLQLEIWIKAGATFTQVGTQQLVSVPYALFANDVRSSYNSNVLTIGANSYSISSGSAATPTINGTGLVTVTPNTGPVYNVNVPTPTINFSANTLIYSQGTFVTSSTPFNPTISGDAFGPISTTTVTALRNIPIANVTPFANQVLTYNGSAWTPSLAAALPSGWSLIGNSATTSSINFIGTTDAKDLNIRTNNATRVTILSNGNVGIGTTIPNGKLDVAGETVTDSIQITSPVAPVAGAHLLSRDNVGNTKWSPGPVAFQFHFAPTAAITVSTNIVNDLGNNIQFSASSSVSIGGGFNTTNARFTAPVSGLYEFNASLEILLNPAAAGNNWIYLEICKNPATPVILKRSLTNNHDASITTYFVLQVHTLVNLTAGEVVFLRADGNSGGTGGQITTANQPNFINSFSGHLIR